jgi:hypothetical protein
MGRVKRAGLAHRTNNTSSYEEREIITIISLRPAPLSSRGVTSLGRSPRRLFECRCDQCQGYAVNDPGEPYLDDV